MCSLMHRQKNTNISALEILLEHQILNVSLKNLLMLANKKADFSLEVRKSFIFSGMGEM